MRFPPILSVRFAVQPLINIFFPVQFFPADGPMRNIEFLQGTITDPQVPAGLCGVPNSAFNLTFFPISFNCYQCDRIFLLVLCVWQISLKSANKRNFKKTIVAVLYPESGKAVLRGIFTGYADIKKPLFPGAKENLKIL